jgi:antibiotic biosynthesis monooxygenase (ABM) superfamily enzyme
MRKKKATPSPYAALTKDTRFAGTYEVLVPDDERVKPHRIALQFATHESAESWIHSPEGVETIARVLHPRRQ